MTNKPSKREPSLAELEAAIDEIAAFVSDKYTVSRQVQQVIKRVKDGAEQAK